MSFVPKYRDVLATLGAPEDAVATSTSGEWSAMSLLKAIYAGVQTIGNPELDIAGDTGTITILLATETFTVVGGTGLSTTAAANGVTVDIDDAELLAIAGLTSAADRLPYFTGSGTASLATFTSAGRDLLDDATATAQLTTLGLSANGKSLVTAADYAAMKALLDLEIGTDVQAYDATLTTYAGIDPSANVQSILGAADYSAVRTLLGLVIGTNVQAYDADLTTWAGLTPSANAQSLVTAADYAAMKALLDLEIGTDVQAYDATLTTYAGIDPSANVQTLLGAADFAAVRTSLGLVIGTNVQAYDADLTTWAGLTPSANAQSLVTAADYAAMRGLLDLEAGTDFLSPAAIAAAYQPLDADLTAIAALTTTAAGLTLLTIADPGADRPVVWDDTASTFKAMALADMTDEPTPATGDYVMIMGAEGDWRKADWSTLPGAGGGINNVSEDTSPSLGGALDGDGFDVIDIGVLTLREQAAAEADVAGLGQIWVQTATPNLLMFTDDAGTDFQLATLTGTETLTNKTLSSATNTYRAASTTVVGASEFATTAEYQTGTDTARSLVVDQVWAAGALTVLNDSGGNIAVDMSTGINFSMTMDGDYTLSNPTNTKVGQTGAFVFTQDGTGTQTLAYGTNYEFAGGTAFVLSTAAGAKDIIFYWVQSSTSIVMTGILKAVA
jgi:hypothetical protein